MMLAFSPSSKLIKKVHFFTPSDSARSTVDNPKNCNNNSIILKQPSSANPNTALPDNPQSSSPLLFQKNSSSSSSSYHPTTNNNTTTTNTNNNSNNTNHSLTSSASDLNTTNKGAAPVNIPPNLSFSSSSSFNKPSIQDHHHHHHHHHQQNLPTSPVLTSSQHSPSHQTLKDRSSYSYSPAVDTFFSPPLSPSNKPPVLPSTLSPPKLSSSSSSSSSTKIHSFTAPSLPPPSNYTFPPKQPPSSVATSSPLPPPPFPSSPSPSPTFDSAAALSSPMAVSKQSSLPPPISSVPSSASSPTQHQQQQQQQQQQQHHYQRQQSLPQQRIQSYAPIDPSSSSYQDIRVQEAPRAKSPPPPPPPSSRDPIQNEDFFQYLLGSSSSRNFSDETLRAAINLRTEQEKTKQEFYKLELRKKNAEILNEAIRHNIPPSVMPLLFNSAKDIPENVPVSEYVQQYQANQQQPLQNLSQIPNNPSQQQQPPSQQQPQQRLQPQFQPAPAQNIQQYNAYPQPSGQVDPNPLNTDRERYPPTQPQQIQGHQRNLSLPQQPTIIPSEYQQRQQPQPPTTSYQHQQPYRPRHVHHASMSSITYSPTRNPLPSSQTVYQQSPSQNLWQGTAPNPYFPPPQQPYPPNPGSPSTSVHQIIQFHHWQPNQNNKSTTSPKKDTAALNEEGSSIKRRRSTTTASSDRNAPDRTGSPTPGGSKHSNTPSTGSGSAQASANAHSRRRGMHSRHKSETSVLRGDTLSKMSLYSGSGNNSSTSLASLSRHSEGPGTTIDSAANVAQTSQNPSAIPSSSGSNKNATSMPTTSSNSVAATPTVTSPVLVAPKPRPASIAAVINHEEKQQQGGNSSSSFNFLASVAADSQRLKSPQESLSNFQTVKTEPSSSLSSSFANSNKPEREKLSPNFSYPPKSENPKNETTTDLDLQKQLPAKASDNNKETSEDQVAYKAPSSQSATTPRTASAISTTTTSSNPESRTDESGHHQLESADVSMTDATEEANTTTESLPPITEEQRSRKQGVGFIISGDNK